MSDMGVFDEGHISEVELELDLSVIKTRLLSDPDFVSQLRSLLLKDARKMGNTMGKWAQAQPAAPSQQRRLS